MVSANEESNRLQKLLILYDRGSLCAFGYVVFKAIEKHRIKRDIIAGSSIWGINTAIFVVTKGNGERFLES